MFNIIPPLFLDAVILFIFAEALLCISPGPAVLLTISQSMRRGFAAGIWSTMGILTANPLYFVLSAIGVGALLVASATLFTIVKYIGAAYLVFMGVKMLIPLFKSVGKSGKVQADNSDDILVDKSRETSKSTFIRGFIIQASNPKNLVFFVALLPQFVMPSLVDEISLMMQFSILAFISIIIEFLVLLVYILLSVKLAKWVKAKAMMWIDGAAGGFLIIIGVGLASMKKLSNAS